MTTAHGIYYFPSVAAARAYAAEIGAPTDRIIEYLLGWAIQWHISGPYVGPGALTHARCRYCPPETP